MELVNKGRKVFTTKAQYEREPLAGCYCSNKAASAKAYDGVGDSTCVCACSSSTLKSGNKTHGRNGSARDGVQGGWRTNTFTYIEI